ncbi:putative CRISPR-associated protein [Candidatus Micrarchaeota archaeon]|nr:putative CRISPR-associated protein [Candidatus Micrarchaeota archaeon]
MTKYSGTFILVTVGTSALGNVRRALNTNDLPSIQEALEVLKRVGPEDRTCGAEVNSNRRLLEGMRLSCGETLQPYELMFLVSETDEGRWTGDLLKAYYNGLRGVDKADWKEIEGLSPVNAGRFARLGLRNLVRESSALLRNAEGKGFFRVINATGGFKAQISFAGLIGQTLGVPVIYQFEKFDDCVEMPPMPVDFDREIWLMHYDLFMRLSEKGALLEKDYPFDELDPVIRELLDVVEEGADRLYSLSPILELMHQGFLSRRPRQISKPSAYEAPLSEKVKLVKSEEAHDPVGTRKIAEMMVRKFDWIKEIKNHTPRMNSARSHLLPRRGEIDRHWICYSDGVKGVRLSIKTSCEHDGHYEYVSERLAEFLADL